ncbi:MAG: NADH-quinone oxidoreductase subunit K [Acidobacteriota bacterium]|nr:NADH-quinone oxidoreductase subunit K [Acidobacteriota bacterium]
MEPFWAVIVGVLFAAAVYMLLRRHLAKLAIGLILLSNAANLLILSAPGLVRGRPDFVPEGAQVLGPGHADPLPQALILTAIVIGFGVLAFFLALMRRVFLEVSDLDVEMLKE